MFQTFRNLQSLWGNTGYLLLSRVCLIGPGLCGRIASSTRPPSTGVGAGVAAKWSGLCSYNIYDNSRLDDSTRHVAHGTYMQEMGTLPEVLTNDRRVVIARPVQLRGAADSLTLSSAHATCTALFSP
jgi:hypothetical protein